MKVGKRHKEEIQKGRKINNSIHLQRFSTLQTDKNKN